VSTLSHTGAQLIAYRPSLLPCVLRCSKPPAAPTLRQPQTSYSRLTSMGIATPPLFLSALSPAYTAHELLCC
jgi:hypothetical protein